MKKEYKELLLKDLSARFPYGVIVQEPDFYEAPLTISTLSEVFYDGLEVKPYLRPMSSMTEEEKRHCFMLEHEGNIEHPNGIFYRSQDYLNSIHIAYRTIDGKDMFELGLAIEAPEGMYQIK